MILLLYKQIFLEVNMETSLRHQMQDGRLILLLQTGVQIRILIAWNLFLLIWYLIWGMKMKYSISQQLP